MRAIYIIFVCLVISRLCTSDRGQREPYMVRLDDDQRICAVNREDCREAIERLQEYLIRALNIERYLVTEGDSHLRIPIATNMLRLERDLNLEKMARGYVSFCSQTPSVEECVRKVSSTATGEIISSVRMFSAHSNVQARDRLAETVISWTYFPVLEEESLLKFIKEYNPLDKQLQNMAKLLNAEVSKVGCWFLDYYASANQFEEVFVCVFGPPKLVSGGEVYRAGCVPCSECPQETSCGTTGSFANSLCGLAIIHVKGKCMSMMAFQQKIDIQEKSCLRFYYYKHRIGRSASNKVIAFVYDDDKNRILRAEKYRDGDQSMLLNVSWSGVQIHAGFGTSSFTEEDEYKLIVRDFSILKGECPAL